MAIYDKIGDEKLQYNITREAAKIALSSGKIDKYDSYRRRNVFFYPKSNDQMIEQTKFTHPPLEKAFKKQIKTIEDRGRNKFKLQKC